MDNLAYLHLSSAYEDCSPSELVSFGSFVNPAAPDWKKLSSRAWKYMLPLALILSIFGAFSNVVALERGDQGPSVRNLQKQLKTAGFYQAPITQVYDSRTERAVRRFQKAAGLSNSGIAGSATLEKLDGWNAPSVTSRLRRIGKTSHRHRKLTNVRYQPNNTDDIDLTPSKSRNSGYLNKGDEGEAVRALQQKLRIAGFYYGNTTGIFGPITEEAVRRFQAAYNLDVDGIVGPATQSKLPPSGVGYGENESPKKSVEREKLRQGNRGEAVRVLQEQLIKAEYLEGEPTGYYGPNTADAVRRFQDANKLTVSGVAGPTTRAKLYSSVNTASSKSESSKREFNVLEIQRRLKERGFYKGPLNGALSRETKRAIRQAQDFYGISLNDIRSGRL